MIVAFMYCIQVAMAKNICEAAGVIPSLCVCVLHIECEHAYCV